mmetsp:Transcript_148171/g.258568  ORF Transcript_148171/g.258568 Transcript_148171/m.258568 type:complete len:203 (-) Transcript_148171:65-673(-)
MRFCTYRRLHPRSSIFGYHQLLFVLPSSTEKSEIWAPRNVQVQLHCSSDIGHLLRLWSILLPLLLRRVPRTPHQALPAAFQVPAALQEYPRILRRHHHRWLATPGLRCGLLRRPYLHLGRSHQFLLGAAPLRIYVRLLQWHRVPCWLLRHLRAWSCWMCARKKLTTAPGEPLWTGKFVRTLRRVLSPAVRLLEGTASVLGKK